MFSSSNNINPFPQHPSGSSSSSAFQVPFMGGGGGGSGEGFFPYHLHDPLSGYLVPSASYYNTNAPISHEALISNMAVMSSKKDGGNGGKKAVRKDRHSKICTSQGLRDRRVRLSIEISREFFDLQDMLGFDKASKTLEWLLDKSRKDIKQLEEQIKHSKGNANSDLEVNDDVEDEGGDDPAEKKMKKSSNKDDYARECRAKARERARERTKEKLCTSNSNNSSTITTSPTTRMVQEQPRKSCPDHHHQQHHHHSNPYVFTQLRSACEDQLGSHNGHSNTGCYQQQANQPIIEDIIQESIVIKRKLMKSPLVSDSSRGFVDWDISSAMTRSSLCAGNLSTELQMYGKH